MFIGALLAFPILYGLSMSLMSDALIASYPPKIIPVMPNLDNYYKVFETVPILRFVINSLLVSVAVMLMQVLTSSLAAYGFVFFNFKYKKLLFMCVLATMMIPSEATLISNYLNVTALKMLNSYPGLILPFAASAMGVFMMRQSYLTTPKELKEAATVDGCGDLRFYATILMPISMPAVGALAIFTFINTWNQYMWPLLITNSTDMRTVQIGISMLQFADGLSYGIIMAGFVVILVPSIAIFVLGQRRMVGGLTAGAVKG